MLDEETKAALIHIAQTGQCDDVESYKFYSYEWSGLTSIPKLRIKKRRPIIAPEIWKVLPKEYTCISWDKNGSVHAYDKCQLNINFDDFCLAQGGKNFAKLNFLKGLDLNGCDWRESLCERPE